jgi:photosystem II stability/assembly factor-like uncharacterized protein
MKFSAIGPAWLVAALVACSGTEETNAACSGSDCDAGVDSAAPTDSTTPSDADVDSTKPDAVSDAPPSCVWQPEMDGLRGGLVDELSSDPRTPALIWASSGSRVYRSKDSGASWALAGEAPGGVAQFAYPAAKNTLLAATSRGIVRSEDDGKTWSKLALDGLDVVTLVAHPKVTERLYATARGTATVFRSSDGGGTWSAVGSGLPAVDIATLAIDPVDPDTVIAGGQLAGTSEGVLVRTTNGGASWEKVESSAGVIRSLRRCRGDNARVFAATDVGLMRSTDGGKTWSKPTLTTSFLSDIDTGASCDEVFVAGRFEGVRRSTDGGGTFGPASPLPATGKPDFGASKLVVDAANPKRLLAAFVGGIASSADSGATWTPAELTLQVPITRMTAQSPAGPFWIGTWGMGAWRREAVDKPWQRIGVANFPLSRAFGVHPDPFVKGRVFIAGWSDLYRSTDEATFTKILSDNVFSVAFDKGNPMSVWIGTQLSGFFHSTDGGASFNPANEGLVAWPSSAGTTIDIRFVLVLPGGEVLAGTYGKGLLRREAGNWIANDVTASTEVRCLEAAGDVVYACINEKGVVRSVDKGKTWTFDNGGLTSLRTSGIAYDTETKRTYLTSASGVFVRAASGDWGPLDASCTTPAAWTSPVIMATPSGKRLGAVGNGGIFSHAL